MPILWAIRVSCVWCFLGLTCDFDLVFSAVWVHWSLVWLIVTSILWLFAYFFRFYIRALRHLGAFVSRASLGSFLVFVRSVDFGIASLHSFDNCLSYCCIFWVTDFVFIQISLCFILNLDYMAHWCLWDFSWFWETFGRFEIWLFVPLSEICLFCSLNIISRIYSHLFSVFLVHLTIKHENKKNIYLLLLID